MRVAVQRRAEFIWTPDQEIEKHISFRDFIAKGPVRRIEGKNRWYLFRKTFSLNAAVEMANIDITADGRYILFVNEYKVGRGPSRCSPHYQRVDTYDVTPFLDAGNNAVSVLVHSYGADNAWYETVKDYWQALFGDGGLYCVCYSGDSAPLAATDSSWRCTEALAWNRETPVSGWGQDFIEDYDARKAPHGWTTSGFDDSGWQSAQVLLDQRSDDDRLKGFGPIRAFPTLVARDIPHLVEKCVAPTRILAINGVRSDPELPIERRIYEEKLLPCPSTCIEERKAFLADDDSLTTVCTASGIDVSMLIAFDDLRAGYPFVEIDASGSEVIEIAVAETYSGEFHDRQLAEPRIERRSFLDCAHVFRYTARPGFQRFEKFEWTAVRYMQLVVRNAPGGLKIRHAGINSTHYPVENQGSFECSDPMLTRLWKIARHTVLQCSHDAWEDCPGREKRQWVGDGVVRYPIAAAAFGTSVQALDKRFLRQCAESQRSDGLLQMYAPGDHKTHGIVIPDYSLHFVLVAHDYMMHTGDLETLQSILPGIQNVLAWFSRQVGISDLIVNMPYWHFIEWADVDRSGESACVNALYAAALNCAAEIASQLEFERLEAQYSDQARVVREAINKRLWNAKLEVYADSLNPEAGALSARVSQQANSLILLFDIAPVSRRQRIIDYITDSSRVKLTSVPPVVPTGYPFDVNRDVVQCNTFFSHFLFSALAHCNRFNLALQQIRDHYEPMLATGTTTLWESFDPTASLCHAFSATPLYQLSAHLLGVRPTEPGFAKFIVAPQFHDVDFAKGKYPTPAGGIEVSWRRADDVIEIVVDVPSSIEGRFLTPESFRMLAGNNHLLAGRNEITISENSEYG